jgi:bifunctional non-homologous end joining protein LigD
VSPRPAPTALTFPVAPMKATLGTLPTEDSGWAYEVKWDGYRTLAFVGGGRVRLQSSNLHDVTARYPEMQALAAELGGQQAILDGELVVLDDRGRPRFELIQRKEADRLEAVFFVFDVLSIDAHDTIGLVYEDRRRLLREVLDDGPNWQVPAHRLGDGPALLAATEAQELEGVMAKRLGTTYRPGARSKDWRKVKHRRKAEVVIGGFTRGTGNRSSTFGSLLVGRWDGDRLAFAGGVGTGFNQRRLEELTARFADLRTTECPFDPPPPTAYRRDAVWIEPVLGAHVELTEFTNDGYVRQSSFIDLIEPA